MLAVSCFFFASVACDCSYMYLTVHIAGMRLYFMLLTFVFHVPRDHQVKVGRYYLEQLIADLDNSKESSNTIRQRLGNPTALGNFLQLCHLRLLHERDVSFLSYSTAVRDNRFCSRR